jgi:hypothetical protein
MSDINARPAIRSTCGGCAHLELHNLPMNRQIYGCKKTGAVVPQHSSLDDSCRKRMFVFWRVPLNCPLPDTEVRKSADKAPRSEWVTIDGGAVHG